MANSVSADSSCKIYWRFEDSPGFTIDSKGNNDLTNPVGGAEQENIIVKEGSQSAKFVRADFDRMYIEDSALDTGVPLRYLDSSSVTKNFTICTWFYPIINTAEMGIVTKYGAKRTFAIWVEGIMGKIIIKKGYNNGASFEYDVTSSICTKNQWYHVGFGYQESDKSYTIITWDDNANDFFNDDLIGNFLQETSVTTSSITLGAQDGGGQALDGYIDETIIFDRKLRKEEINAIRKGRYPRNFGISGFQNRLSSQLHL